MTSTGDPRRPGLFSRLTEPLAEKTRERIEHVEDKVRSSIQSEIDAVSRSVRARALEVRLSALLFAGAAVLTFLGLALLVGAGVVGLAHVVPLWLSCVIVAVVLIAVATGLAAWGRRRLPAPVRVARPAPLPAKDAEELVHPWTD